MPHVREKERRPDEEPQRDQPGGQRKPTGELGGQPINADETAAREHAPDPGGATETRRAPDAVDDQPGNDL